MDTENLLNAEALSEKSWRTETSRSGEPTAYLNGRALHSRFDPKKEALRAAQNAPEAAILVLGGLGLGYVAEALLEERPDLRLVVAEADPMLPARAAAVRNMDKILRQPRVSLFAGGNPAEITELLKGGAAGASLEYMEWKPSAAAHPAWYARLREVVADTRQRRNVNARTLERFGPLWVRNLTANIPNILRAVSLAPWENTFTDIPALIIAGGPSLEKLLPELKVLQERFLLIAVDTAAWAVLAQGVRPDIIAAVDPQYWNTRHLDKCARYEPGTEDILILAESATHPAVFRRLKGRPWLTRTRFPLGTLLEDAAGIQGVLEAGGSVATAAWDLARYLGCPRLFAAGLDLGFPGRQTHFSGSLSRERPLIYSQRTSPAENAFFHALHSAGCRNVPAADGGEVLSDARMDVYAAWFSESARKIPERQPALAGSSGRAVEGMGTVSLNELKAFPACRMKIDKKLSEIRRMPSDKAVRQRVQDVLLSMTDALKELHKAAETGIQLTRQAGKMLKEGRSPEQYIKQMDEIDRRILGGEGKELVSFLIQPIILSIQASASSADTHPLETSRKLYRQIAFSAAYHCLYMEKAAEKIKTNFYDKEY